MVWCGKADASGVRWASEETSFLHGRKVMGIDKMKMKMKKVKMKMKV
jgi:hypothetical protein